MEDRVMKALHNLFDFLSRNQLSDEQKGWALGE